MVDDSLHLFTESRMEQDRAELRDLKSADQFLARLAAAEAATLTDDYWTKTLPTELAISAGCKCVRYLF
jgi:hypothetical protein